MPLGPQHELASGLVDVLTTLQARLERLRVVKGWFSVEFSLSSKNVLTVIYEPVEGHVVGADTEDFNQPAIFAEFLESLE